MKQLLLFILVCFTLTAFSQKKDITAIQNLLSLQQKAWNAGNIEAFMEGYWKNDSLVFVGAQGPQYGWESTYNRYVKTYDSPEKMGQLK